MDLSQRVAISYYQTVAAVNEDHQVYLVQHRETGKFFIKKHLEVYSPDVYDALRERPVFGVPEVLEFCEEDGTLTLIEEYVPGTTLREIIASGRLTAPQAGDYMLQLCSILEQLHSHGPAIIHRDIKPSNIMVTPGGHVFLLDFNAAKLSTSRTVPHNSSDAAEAARYHADDTADTMLLGTHGYAAPEQYGFAKSTPQTDLFALGVVLREAVSSFSGEDHTFDAVIAKCTQMDPAERYGSADEVRRALLQAMGKKVEKATDIGTAAQSSFHLYLPPGFRTMTLWKMLIAVSVYALVIWLCLSMESKGTYGAALWLERVFSLIIVLGSIFISCNYLGVLDRFPLYSNTNRAMRIIGALALIALYVFTAFIVLLVLMQTLFGRN